MSVWQSCRFSGRLLEDNAVLVLDERVLQLAVAPAVADAVVLDLDDDGADFAMREVDLRGQASWMGLAGFDVRSRKWSRLPSRCLVRVRRPQPAQTGNPLAVQYIPVHHTSALDIALRSVWNTD